MKKSMPFFLIVIAASFCAIAWHKAEYFSLDSEVNGKSIHIKAATYNIRYQAAADEKTGNGWEKRKKPLADLIRSHDFDIGGTQEGNFSQMHDLMTLLPKYAYIGYPMADTAAGCILPLSFTKKQNLRC
jgi:hypothetical protein